MKMRSTVSGKPAKARRPKALKLKRAPPSHEPSRPTSSAAGKEGEVARLTRELKDALEQQTATADVLRMISSSPTDVQPVLDVIVQTAGELCASEYSILFRLQDGKYHVAASNKAAAEFVKFLLEHPISVDRGSLVGRTALACRSVHIEDCLTDPEYVLHEAARLGKHRTMLGVPLLREGIPIGVIGLLRTSVKPFTGKQIELVTTFANQAVIAIENARVLNELRQRTTDLSEALEQQTATSDVLSIISSSPSDLQPVFKAILENATRICGAKFGFVHRYDGEFFQPTAQVGAPTELVEFHRKRGAFRPDAGAMLDRMIHTKQVGHTPDIAAETFPVAAAKIAGARSTMAVPMLKDGILVGALVIYRQEVRPFTHKQIALVQNFAAQAAIAIENARLLNELRQRTTDLTERTTDLTEALEQQTATSEVLQVISSSPGDLEPVFQAMLENATRICEAKFGVVFSFDGNEFHFEAQVGTPPELAEHNRARPMPQPLPGSHLDRLRQTKRVSYTADYAAEGIPAPPVTLGGARSTVDVPMLKDNELVGAFSIYRQEVRPFTEKQIELVKNFAAQAVIAIENARLLNELRQSLEQQTGTSEVLRVISSSPSDLEAVFRTMLENATRICEAKFGTLDLHEGNGLRLVAAHGVPPAFAEARGEGPFHPAPGGILDTAMKTGRAVHIPDLAATQSYTERHPRMVDAVEVAGIRTAVGVPMLKGNELIGIIAIYRPEVRPFSDKQIALLTNFADQAVIAIENARLLRELRERTSQLEMQSKEVLKLNQQLEHRVADQVGEIERMGRLRRFLPPQVADLIVASGAEKQLESHRREITALFCDLRGFTGFTESADAEDVMALLRDYHASIGEKIIKYNGTLERYAGDGVMVVFNDPVPVENPALQAVLMALELRNALGALTQTWSRLGHEIGFGIGIAHGFATLGTIGYEGRFDYAAIGTVSNVASRLCDEAKPGQILISPRVLTKVEDAVTVEPVGEFELKGIRRPLAAYNVVGALSREPE